MLYLRTSLGMPMAILIPPHVDHVLSKPPKLRELREALARCWELSRRLFSSNSAHP